MPRVTGGYYWQGGEWLLSNKYSFVAVIQDEWECVCCVQWKENPVLTESQVQAIALNRQANVEMEIKRREAIYRDILGRQQAVRAAPCFVNIKNKNLNFKEKTDKPF